MRKKAPNAVARACEAAGSQAQLARSLGVTEQAVSSWVRRGWVPKHRAPEIEALYGVPRKSMIDPRLMGLIEPAIESAL